MLSAQGSAHGGRGHGKPVSRDSASLNAIIRDAKGQSLELKLMLKRKSDPWDREVEFQREALRKAYLQIIFNPSMSSLSTSSAVLNAAAPTPTPKLSSTSHMARLLDVMNLLWLETSHALIHVYRAKVSEMDKIIESAPNAHRGGARGGPGGGSRGTGGSGGSSVGRANNIPGPTARRRLVHSFRAFLGQEEEFFRALLSRLAASLYPADLAGLRALGVTVKHSDEANGDGREEDSQDDAVTLSPVTLSPEERAARRNGAVPLAHKALVCFGDLARYRELYNEPGAGNPHAGVQPRADGGSKKGRGKPDGERKTKNWTRAAECYHQARLLLPDNGNPSNQLAVLSQYAADHVSSTYHYYRALSVRSPFPTARTNLEITYTKSISKWFAEEGGEPDGDEGVKFRSAFVALQGLYFTKTRVPDIPALSARVQKFFRISVEQRLLPSDLIVKTVVTGLCALWDARMFRTSGRRSHGKGTDKSSSSSQINIEPHLVLHVLSLYRILLEVGSVETTELVATNVDPTNLALNISAVLRRTLPALRILSKWLMGQIEYISRVEARVEAKEKKRDASAAENGASDDFVRLKDLRRTLREFWTAYVGFANAIKGAFPLDSLPSAMDGEVWLEEDVDMLGFAPLRGTKKEATTMEGVAVEISRVGKDVHPNEEQLMRISGVQTDARLVAASETSVVALVDDVFVVTLPDDDPDSPEAVEAYDVAVATQRISEAFGAQAIDYPMDDEEYDEEGYDATEDDPVDLAMRVATGDRMDLDDEEEDEDEEIVFTGSQGLQNHSLLPSAIPPPTIPRSTNDLLQQILNGNTTSPANGSPYSTANSSPPIAGRSIWAPTDIASSPLPPPANPSAIGSFESLPNMTHQAFAPAAQPPAFRHPSFSAPAIPLPQPPAPSTIGLTRSPSLFGNFSPFTSPASHPLPIPASFGAAQTSDLSPHASVFAQSPQRNAYAYGPGATDATGWPDLSPVPTSVVALFGPPPGLFAGPPPGFAPPPPPGFGYSAPFAHGTGFG